MSYFTYNLQILYRNLKNSTLGISKLTGLLKNLAYLRKSRSKLLLNLLNRGTTSKALNLGQPSSDYFDLIYICITTLLKLLVFRELVAKKSRILDLNHEKAKMHLKTLL